jgi:hypothetical protein
MLESSRRRLLETLPADAVVLDVGGWADPFERADWVIDLMPYETRGLYGREGWVTPRTEPERFTAETWIQRDLCDREPFPFADDEVDFVICSHTLEDLRDPVWVCGELIRVAKAGYLELPSRLEEQSWGVNGPFVGWSHHRWLVDVGEHGVEFVSKPHLLHSSEGRYFPAGFWERLSDAERVQTLWWEGGFSHSERVIFDAHESEEYLSGFVARELAARPAAQTPPAPKPGGLRSRLRRRARPTPQLDEPWRSAFAASLVTPLNLYFLHELAERVGRLEIDGDIVECGVYRGGSAAVLGWSMMRLGGARKLWLFDSFAGMPPAGERDGEFSRGLEGGYVGSELQTRQLLERVGVPPDRYEIVKGLFADTFATVEAPPVALLHVDCDFYEPVKLTLEKFYPRVTAGGFVVLNDYGIYKGAKDATDEFLAGQDLEIEPVAIDPTAAFFQKPGAGFSGLPAAGHYPGWPGAVA